MIRKLIAIYKDAMRYRWLRERVTENLGKLRLCVNFSGQPGQTFERYVDGARRFGDALKHGIDAPPRPVPSVPPVMPLLRFDEKSRAICARPHAGPCPMDYSAELGAYFCTYCRHAMPKGPR